jgi:hypothetical protein
LNLYNVLVSNGIGAMRKAFAFLNKKTRLKARGKHAAQRCGSAPEQLQGFAPQRIAGLRN